MKFYAFDIETIPAEDIPSRCLPKFDPSEVNIPANWGQEAREKKIAQEEKRFLETLAKKRSTDPLLCRPVSFCGYSSMGDEWIELYAADLEAERELMTKAWEWLQHLVSTPGVMVTFNGKGFDLPVLWHRAIKLRVPAVTREAYLQLIDTKRSNRHADLCLDLAPRGFTGQPEVRGHGFDFWLDYYGVGNKPEGWNGSVVYQAFIDGWHEDIAAYNRSDVENLKELYLRVSGAVHWG